MPRKHRRFSLLLLVFAAGVLLHQWTLPLLEGSDESLHFAFAEYLREHQSLPDRASYRTNPMKQETGQPPLTYVGGALVAEALRLPALGDIESDSEMFDALGLRRNPWNTPADITRRGDNHNFYYQLAGEAPTDTPITLRVLRLTSLVYGLVAVVGAYGAAQEVFQREAWALTATAVFAFMPTMVHVSSYYTNDISAIAFTTLTMWAALRLLRVGMSVRLLLTAGVLMALGALSKVNAALVAPAVGVALLLDWRKRRYSFGRLILNGMVVALPVIVISGPWLVWGWLTFDDPVGFRTHQFPGFFYDPPLTLRQTLPFLPEVYLSYWGRFGLSVYFTTPTYTVFTVLLLVSLTGYAVWMLRGRLRWNLQVQQALVLSTLALMTFLGLVRWVQLTPHIPGRLLYPAHVALSIGLVGGLALLARTLPRPDHPLRLATVGVVAVTGLLGSSLVTYGAYQPPELIDPADLPFLRGGPIDFEETVRLLGYTQSTAVLRGDVHTLTMCWEVMKPTERPIAYSVKVMDAGEVITERTTLHGLGLRSSVRWRGGEVFCDPLDLSLTGKVPNRMQTAQVYDVILTLLDADTYAADWQATSADGTSLDLVTLARVASPAGEMPVRDDLTAADITFPNLVSLDGYTLTGQVAAGETLTLNLAWSVIGETDDSWTQFVHLIGESESWSLADGVPLDGDYPTWAWSDGERLADVLSMHLPDDLPAGVYDVGIGFYRPDTGERLPVSVNGETPPERIAVVTELEFE